MRANQSEHTGANTVSVQTEGESTGKKTRFLNIKTCKYLQGYTQDKSMNLKYEPQNFNQDAVILFWGTMSRSPASWNNK